MQVIITEFNLNWSSCRRIEKVHKERERERSTELHRHSYFKKCNAMGFVLICVWNDCQWFSQLVIKFYILHACKLCDSYCNIIIDLSTSQLTMIYIFITQDWLRFQSQESIQYNGVAFELNSIEFASDDTLEIRSNCHVLNSNVVRLFDERWRQQQPVHTCEPHNFI